METGYSKWRKLDNAALAFPLVTGKNDSRVFRFYCQLKEEVDPDILQKALDQTMEKYPLFQAVLRKGLFWFYLERRDIRAVVKPEKKPPCSQLYIPDQKSLLFRVSYHRNRINFEVYHALTDGAKPIDFTITENGKIVDLTDEAHSIYNQIKRGDIEGVKIGAGTHKRLADVPFRITSKTTGENHVVVTDDNGQFSTSADWASHKHNTNAGKTSEDGVWFGTSEPDDSKGALPYDTYIIEEMRCDSNKGFELIPPFEIVVSRNNLVIDLGTLTDEYEKEISIHTTATSKDGEKTILAGKEVTIVDTVKLDGLTKGTKYQLKGWQMLKEENAELIIDGKRVENDYTFVADDEEMKVEISYTFNASELGGKNLVTFEELYDLSNPDEPVKVAEHKDIEDDGQTVLITERIIKIHTTATDKDGNKEIEAGKDVTIIDTVTLEGLEVGTQYKLVGWQMLKEENAELLINGKRVESDYTFTADSETMKVEVAFTFDATSLDGKQLVTFEELYDLSNPDEPKKVTEHKDIEDKGQTITFKEKPEEPEKPETPPTPEKPNRPSDSPKTGDSTNVMAFIVMLLASAGGLAAVQQTLGVCADGVEW